MLKRGSCIQMFRKQKLGKESFREWLRYSYFEGDVFNLYSQTKGEYMCGTWQEMGLRANKHTTEHERNRRKIKPERKTQGHRLPFVFFFPPVFPKS